MVNMFNANVNMVDAKNSATFWEKGGANFTHDR